uniref:Immunoglobulin C1-set domain-containing protein n=1 Tax=Sander lucioperca TaxID=283035 RepID=A0A8D0AD11_SANLU
MTHSVLEHGHYQTWTPQLFNITTLHTSDVTQTPDILWGKKGDNATINCSHTKDAGYNQMYWYRQLPGETMKLIVVTNGVVRRNSAIVDLCQFFTCESAVCSNTYPAEFGEGTKLTVLEQDRAITEPTVKVLPPSKKECQKDGAGKKTIVCVARGFYPDHVSVYWQVNLENVTDGVATDNAALREGEYYRITSRLRVSGKDWFTLNKRFTCIVNFFNGNATSSHEATVLGVKGLFFWNSEMI